MIANFLRYSICDETLYGTLNGSTLSMKAFSGGGRGSTTGIERKDLQHWNSDKKAPDKFSEANRGGPLPKGHYVVTYFGRHEDLGLCAELTQTLTSILRPDPSKAAGFTVTPRGGFFIHGTGPHGSDGCIVPAKTNDLKDLLNAIKRARSTVLLQVHSEGMNAERLDLARSFARAA